MKRQFYASENSGEATRKLVEKELKLGFLNLEEGFFEQAQANFNLALAFDEHAPDAFWGQMLCKLGAKSEDELLSMPVQHKGALSMEECKKAQEFAGEDLKKIYQTLLENVQKVCLGDEY